MSEWRHTTLGEVCELKRGYDLPKRARRDGPYPIVSSSGTTGCHEEAKVKGPGVVTGRYGTLGQVFLIQQDFWPLNTSLYVRDFKGNDPRFVAVLLQSMDLGQHEGAAAVPGLNRNQLHQLPVSCPGRSTQSRIADVFQSIDDLIENNRRRVEVLQEMAQAIYREWFVRFRYPGHEDTTFVDSALGPIPEGWEVRALADCARSLEDGDWIETKDQGGSDYRLLQVSNIAVKRFRETGKYRFVSQETFERLRCREIRVGDLLIARMPDPIGRTWLVDNLSEPAITSVDVAILTPSDKAVGHFLNQVLNSSAFFSHADTVASGTTRKRITRKVLGLYEIALPRPELLEHFANVVEPISDLCVDMRQVSDRLTATRDLLLPKLVTGEIDVSELDLDAFVEAAG